MTVLKMNVSVSYADGREVEVTVGPATQVAYEAKFGKPLGSFGDEPYVGELYWLAWHASKSGVEYEAWLESLDGVDLAEEGVAPATPTEPAQPAS